MTETQRTAPKESTIDTLADNKLVRNLVFVGSAGVALTTAFFSTWQEFYRDLVSKEPFRSWRNARDEKIGKVRTDAIEGKISDRTAMLREKVFERQYSAKVAEGIEHMGISKNWLKGTLQRVERLGAYNVGEIAIKTGASLAVTLGGYYLINQNVRLKASNQYQDDRLKELGNRIDAQADRHLASHEQFNR